MTPAERISFEVPPDNPTKVKIVKTTLGKGEEIKGYDYKGHEVIITNATSGDGMLVITTWHSVHGKEIDSQFYRPGTQFVFYKEKLPDLENFDISPEKIPHPIVAVSVRSKECQKLRNEAHLASIRKSSADSLSGK